MVAKIELRMLIPPETSLEYLLSHAITLNGKVYHYVFRDGMTTACGMGIIGASVVPVAEARGRLCRRCERVVRALVK